MTNGIYTNLCFQLEKLRRHNRQGARQTRRRYEEAMRRFLRFLAEVYHLQKMANISEKHLLAYVGDMQKRDLSAAFIKTELSGIRFWHDKISNPRYTLPDNSQLNLECRSTGKINHAWSGEEFRKFIDTCSEHGRRDYIAAAVLARFCGLRIHECFRLDRADAERAIKTRTLMVKGKNGLIREVPINQNVETELRKMLEVTKRGCKLFVDDTQTHLAINQFQKFIIEHRNKFQSVARECPLHFHGLRYAFAQEIYLSLAESGWSETEAKRKLSRSLGHRRLDVVDIYLAGLNKKRDSG